MNTNNANIIHTYVIMEFNLNELLIEKKIHLPNDNPPQISLINKQPKFFIKDNLIG